MALLFKSKSFIAFALVMLVSSILAQKCDSNGKCENVITQQQEEQPSTIEQQQHTNTNNGLKIGIIGSGIGGSSVSYYLRNLVPSAQLSIHEKNDRIGGRMKIFEVNGKSVEIGASIWHVLNKNIDGFADELGLKKLHPFKGEVSAMWNGKEFAYSDFDIHPSINWILDIANVFYSYGFSVLTMKDIVSDTLDKFERLYNDTTPFNTVEEFFKRYELYNHTQVLAKKSLLEKGINEGFIDNFAGAATRVNYNQNIEDITLFGALISMVGSGDKLVSVEGGNKLICEGLIKKSNVNVLLNDPVLSVTKVVEKKEGESEVVEYVVETKSGKKYSYDIVVVAVPIEFANIKFENIELNSATTSVREYKEVHVTFVSAKDVNPDKFGGVKMDHIYTTSSSNHLFYSLAKKTGLTLEDGRSLYKLFSASSLSDSYLSNFFVNSTVVLRDVFLAYPKLVPTPLFPSIILDQGLYYINALESAVSTMETETISSKNVARLIASSLKSN